LNELLKKNTENIESLIKKSKSQLGQDLFVIGTLDAKKSGYFVEFGATDGISLSNTFLLENEFNWTGILAEPAMNWHIKLESNRTCKIDFRCVSDQSGTTLKFIESESGELSTIKGYEEVDQNKRIPTKEYDVKTISLLDLLRFHGSPQVIDYLSIDTEGSEYLILEKFDFSQFKFRVITCEHNFTENREKLFNLLTKNGYKRVWSEFTQFDDWYVNPTLI
jgi:FkbM family methyltransferase